ncbi:Protein FD [Glycine max]|nr:Protein FD [Glycine max]
MEEVWKDINLATLNEQSTISTRPNVEGVMFQDFLARPFTTIDPPNTTLLSSASSETAANSLFSPASPAPPLVTLSLSSLPHHHHFRFEHPSSLPPPPSNKRFAQPADHCSTIGDRRNKRMIKNRESAARSLEHLKEENARLKRQQQQLYEAAVSEQKKKGTLCRASTAPF